jgi:hypothetical protein
MVAWRPRSRARNRADGRASTIFQWNLDGFARHRPVPTNSITRCAMSREKIFVFGS